MFWVQWNPDHFSQILTGQKRSGTNPTQHNIIELVLKVSTVVLNKAVTNIFDYQIFYEIVGFLDR